GEPDRLDHVPGHVRRRDHDPLVAPRWADDGLLADLRLDPSASVLTSDQQHPADEDRDDDHDEPRPERELGDREDDRDDTGRDRADSVDRDASPPALAPVA